MNKHMEVEPLPDMQQADESLQKIQPDLALRGLVLLAQFHGIAADEPQLAHDFGRAGEPFDEQTLLLAAKQLGLKAKCHAHPASRIATANLPALMLGGRGKHRLSLPKYRQMASKY